VRRRTLFAKPPEVQRPDRQISGDEQLGEAVPAVGSGAGDGTPVIVLARLHALCELLLGEVLRRAVKDRKARNRASDLIFFSTAA